MGVLQSVITVQKTINKIIRLMSGGIRNAIIDYFITHSSMYGVDFVGSVRQTLVIYSVNMVELRLVIEVVFCISMVLT